MAGAYGYVAVMRKLLSPESDLEMIKLLVAKLSSVRPSE